MATPSSPSSPRIDDQRSNLGALCRLRCRLTPTPQKKRPSGGQAGTIPPELHPVLNHLQNQYRAMAVGTRTTSFNLYGDNTLVVECFMTWHEWSNLGIVDL
ncbi:hypothetical protein GALMADRAFT_141054 [Galerina marginata CBS 339.88]|uniref:Uncharacterized protein n=1 Tax=Galerina marginata (strain CBS 339.88) TaxID=685588 RepID=A0A067SXB8_GALM3|nr:hypothetical protein GALMADRAFT_141054 [Galerina marginata CBS 339.88]